MRISDWSSDVCSSDLVGHAFAGRRAGLALAQLCARPQNGADILGACRRPSRATEVGTLPASCPRAPGVASARGRRLEIGTGAAKRTTGEKRGRRSGDVRRPFTVRGVWKALRDATQAEGRGGTWVVCK